MEPLRDARGLTENEAIARYRSKNYPRPAMTADIVIFRREAGRQKVLLVKRGGHPFLGQWALPGGFANENEPIEDTAARELREETGVSGLSLRLVDVFSQPGRDPRGWVVSVAYCAAVGEDVPVKAGDDAADARWFTLEGDCLRSGELVLNREDLAFDHGEILGRAEKMAAF